MLKELLLSRNLMLIHIKVFKNSEMVLKFHLYSGNLNASIINLLSIFNFDNNLLIIKRDVIGTEVELLSRVKHRNLVGLVGYCEEEGIN